jgi:hypothetical protein
MATPKMRFMLPSSTPCQQSSVWVNEVNVPLQCLQTVVNLI